MTYREVYNTLTKEASLDKKALIGPLAFLRKNPRLFNAVRKLGPNVQSRSRVIFDWLRNNRKNFNQEGPLGRLFNNQVTSEFWVPFKKFRSIADSMENYSVGLPRIRPADKDWRTASRFLRSMTMEPYDLPEVSKAVKRTKIFRKLNRGSQFGAAKTPYGRYDVTDYLTQQNI